MHDHCIRKSHLIGYNTCKDGKHSTNVFLSQELIF